MGTLQAPGASQRTASNDLASRRRGLSALRIRATDPSGISVPGAAAGLNSP